MNHHTTGHCSALALGSMALWELLLLASMYCGMWVNCNKFTVIVTRKSNKDCMSIMWGVLLYKICKGN